MITKKFLEASYYNEVIMESANFIVIPSLGALVEGWLLIVPKMHYLSFGQINDSLLQTELKSLMGSLERIMQKEYGQYMTFEHGAICEKSSIGCGVDYAHIHVVPLSINLIEECKKIEELNFFWEEVTDIESAIPFAKKELPYLFFSLNGKSFITTSNKIPSQLFRKVIAKQIGLETMWDWKENEFPNNIVATINRLGHYRHSYNDNNYVEF